MSSKRRRSVTLSDHFPSDKQQRVGHGPTKESIAAQLAAYRNTHAMRSGIQRSKGGRSPSRRRSRRRSRKPRCHIGYVRSRSTGRCVYASGRVGRKLNKRRAAVKRSHKRAGRPSPNISATLFPVGHVEKGADGFLWKIRQTSNGVKRWVKA